MSQTDIPEANNTEKGTLAGIQWPLYDLIFLKGVQLGFHRD